MKINNDAMYNLHCFVVPRLLFDGWSYQDYTSVLDSEDEIDEIGQEIVEVAKVQYFIFVI